MEEQLLFVEENVIMVDKCICGHTQLKHSIKDGSYRCNAKKCNCYKYVSLEDADVKHEETEFEKRLRQAKRLGIKVKESGQISTKEEQDMIDFETDKIRKEHDIKVVPEEKLTWYQKVQRDRILKEREEIIAANPHLLNKNE